MTRFFKSCIDSIIPNSKRNDLDTVYRGLFLKDNGQEVLQDLVNRSGYFGVKSDSHDELLMHAGQRELIQYILLKVYGDMKPVNNNQKKGADED